MDVGVGRMCMGRNDNACAVFMSRLTKILLPMALVGVVVRCNGFTPLGPYSIDDTGAIWQVARIGYTLQGALGGPKNAAAGEEYRWNVPTIYYAYDAAFLDFFGTRGRDEGEKAVKILNDLPPASILKVDHGWHG